MTNFIELENQITIYCDLDDVLAQPHFVNGYLDKFDTEKGFFANLPANYENVRAIQKLIDYPHIDIKFLSASPNMQADRDKLYWLIKHFTGFKLNDVIFTRLGENKIKKINRTDFENCVLIDDYSVNLIQWQDAGGKAIKFINTYDNPIGTHTRNKIKGIYSIEEVVDYIIG